MLVHFNLNTVVSKNVTNNNNITEEAHAKHTYSVL